MKNFTGKVKPVKLFAKHIKLEEQVWHFTLVFIVCWNVSVYAYASQITVRRGTKVL